MKPSSPSIPTTITDEVLAGLPTQPGVYIFKDQTGRPIYIGKAVNLRSRVRSYFRPTGDSRASIPLLRRYAVTLETVLTQSNKEALILEESLIKEYKPRYNIRLRDDKSFIFLRLRLDHPFPYVEYVRRPKPDGNPTFGPFPHGLAARQTYRALHSIFPLRTCSNNKFSHRSRACLDHQIGKCPAPCVAKINQTDYQVLVEGARRFLAGDRAPLLRSLKEQMHEAAQELAFEKAAALRDRITALEHTQLKQTTFQLGQPTTDVWAWQQMPGGGQAQLVIAKTIAGRLIDVTTYPNLKLGLAELTLAPLILQHYEWQQIIPERLLLAAAIEDMLELAEVLSQRRGKKIHIQVPQRGDAKRLLTLAQENLLLLGKRTAVTNYDAQAAALQTTLHLPQAPHVIECYDVSVFQGSEPVGVAVCLNRGEIDPQAQRRYKLQAGSGLGDFQWMQEMLTRRLKRGIETMDLPDLIVLDGGKAQLEAVLRVYNELELEWQKIPVVALAKARQRYEQDDLGQHLQERVFLPKRKNPIVLKPGTASFQLLVKLRDATHQAAVGYHRFRGRSALLSGLEQIRGIGAKRRAKILAMYPDLTQILHVSNTDLAQRLGISLQLAQEIQTQLAKLI